jgi:hypothetical protein
MKKKDYIPRKDREYVVWILHFLEVLFGIRERVGFPKEVYDELVRLKDIFVAKFTANELEQTKSKKTASEKNTARKELTAFLRPKAKMYLLYSEHVTDDDRQDLGLTVPSTTREQAHIERPAPDSKERVVNPREVDIDFFPKGQKKGAGKPEDQHEAEILYCVGSKMATSLDELIHRASSTSSPITLVFKEEERGKICSYIIRWVNVVGQPGGWSEIRYFYIP